MPDTPDVSDALGRAYLLAEHLSTSIAAGTRTFGLTTARTRALLCVLENPPMTQRDLANVLRCSTRQVTALVDALEQSGHLRREAHPTDRRAHIVALTDRGRSDAGHIRHLREQAAHDLFDGVPAADLDAFVRVADVLITHRRQQASPDAER
ncbi:MarR family transcriptional regulator [Prescottella soli]|uniref:MarR family transcriptional regulator n=1 Tax=Prescottella soli TaxID=1543852 RepID=A0ABW9FPG5_9NOCA